jgi:hypothetical protein
MIDMDTTIKIETRGRAKFASVNPRATEAGFEYETNDCTVRALAVAVGVPYRDAHASLARAGRQPRHGMYFNELLASWSRSQQVVYGYRFERMAIPSATVTHARRRSVSADGWNRSTTMYLKRNRPTLASILSTLKTGRYLVVITRHVFAVIDGVIYDTGLSGMRRGVEGIYKLESSTVVEAREAASEAALAAGRARYDACKA